MALSLVLFTGRMVDYSCKLSLLVCLGQEPRLRAHFTTLAAAHIAANAHGTYALCRSASRLPRGVAMAGLVVLFGVMTPLMQAVHLLDAAAAWWVSQDLGRRPPMRPAPLDVILEGLVFLCAALHLRVCLILGSLDPPGSEPPLPLTFEALLVLTLISSLVTTTAGLVLWDSTVSIKLSKDMYGWPGQAGRSVCGGGLFAAHLALRGSEVAGKSALLAVFAALMGPSRAAGYVAFSYVANLLVLLIVSYREACAWHLGVAAVLAWPLLFANLPQFVDCPKHAAAARRVAGLVCSLRALELAVAFSAAIATILLEAELESDVMWLHDGEGDIRGDVVRAARAWRALRRRTATFGWCLCLLAHYVCMVTRWCCVQTPAASAGGTAGGIANSGGLPSGRGRREAAALWPQPGAPEEEEQDFWPEAAGLAPLLLAAALERAPVAWWFVSPTLSSSALGVGGGAERQLRVEDFDTIRLIGCGEFGKVFQVRLRSTQEVYAMKRLSKEFYLQRRMTDKAIREISMLSLARNHPFVVKLMFTIENSREWALVMEYCPSGDLQQLLLAEGCPGLALDRTIGISSEVALGLEYLHTSGIVFRDLKLENVVLDQDGHAKLTDFGLAKRYKDGLDAVAEAEQAGGVYASFARTFCGSYGYAAPEVNPRRQVHGFAADMYSFGVLLLMMLMGGEVYHDTREPWERRLPPETPSDLRDVINHLSFDFYWASHHLLRPSGSAHRVEVNLSGDVVVAPRGPRPARRQARPHRPPNSPRLRGADVETEEATLTKHPAQFPALACTGCEAAQRRWDLALDLVRVLTDEFPEHRGTVAAAKRHPFFTEEIGDWRTVYPKDWLPDRPEETTDAPPQSITQRLEELSVEEPAPPQGEPAGAAGA
eukprot:CAMPEP_0168386268 /NCGR_PEP_ID=MMETSP0228-20121227/15340_1 /TAXON_ID=133427 /ORGANISM="Protoceratium reticulatum, Strain CCCM 535 (=CCMP 1889)" /LENGTH=883 /DNA_ID=CAMNT_0008399463 /DNA_START=72 /DNA_END=2723 /DNA_ORIENTATION=-